MLHDVHVVAAVCDTECESVVCADFKLCMFVEVASCCCRSWLREAGLGVSSADEAAPLLENPVRNGVLLCNLAGSQPFASGCTCCYAQHLLALGLDVQYSSVNTEHDGALFCWIAPHLTASCTCARQ